MNTLTKSYKHLQTICRHKMYVAKYCFMCGLYWQGLIHDLSKFSFTEFSESVKYYTGTQSPIIACKQANGYSLSWFHHRGRNKHHWAYWVDDFDQGMIPKKMPFKYALEMACDFLGAGEAYSPETFSIESEIAWWRHHREIDVIHKDTVKLLDILFTAMHRYGIKQVLCNKLFLATLKSKYETSLL